jgi:hypothetical protein
MKKNFKKIIHSIFVLTFILFPVLSFAQTTTSTVKVCSATINNIGDVLCKIGSILNYIIPLLLVLGVVYFVWGVITYVIKDDEEAKKKGRNRIIYGLIGIVVIVSLWGLVGIVVKTFGLNQQNLAIINPANIINNNLQVTKTNSCYGAYTATGNPKLGDLLNYATCIIGTSVIPLLFILAVASFVWGVVQYVINSDEEAKKAKGRSFMIWGIIALAVMVSIWGLVGILRNTFGIENFVPQVKSQ